MNMDSSPLGSITRIDTRGGGPDIEAFPLEFSGSGGEFFRVWIVNLLLTIVTLGFYTPFARRRTAQYFYSHTLVGGTARWSSRRSNARWCSASCCWW